MDSGDSRGCSSYRRNKIVRVLDKIYSANSIRKYVIMAPIILNTLLFPSHTHMFSAKINEDRVKVEKKLTLEERLEAALSYVNPKNVKPYIEEKVDNLVKSEEWRKELEYCLSNLSAFEDYIEEASKETGLGINFIKAYLTLESRGNPEAISKKGATGLGGMMKLAAKESELKVDHHIDERFDPKSIIASARYMRRCIDRFGDVITGLLAYNWGPTSVSDNLNVIMESQDLVKDKRIPLESRWYVVQVLARMKIFSNASFYNLKIEQKPLFSKMFYYEHVVNKDTTLKHLAKLYKVDLEDLRKVNPSLRADIVPTGTKVKIPHKI